MSEQTAAQESSATETSDVFNGENVSLKDYNSFRETGEVPDRFKAAEHAESATVDDTEVNKTESAGESGTPKDSQEPVKPKKPQTAQERIAQIDATINHLWEQDEPDIIKIGQLEATREKVEQRAGLKRKTESAPVTQPVTAQPHTYQDWEKAFDPEKWIEDYAKANPEASYEKASAAMFSNMLNAREQFRAVEQAQRQQAESLAQKVEEGKEIYGEDFGDVADEVAGAIISDRGIPQIVRDRMAHSSILPHLVYTLGSDPKALADFLKTAKSDPFKALDQIALTESLIREEIGGKKAEIERDAKGKFTETPAKQKTNAPKPPSPVSGASTGAFDVSDESLSPEEWMRKRNADLAKR